MKYLYTVDDQEGINPVSILTLLKGEATTTTATRLQADEVQRGGVVQVISSVEPERLEAIGACYPYKAIPPEETHTEKVKELQQKLEEAAAIALEIKDYTVLSSISNVLSIL